MRPSGEGVPILIGTRVNQRIEAAAVGCEQRAEGLKALERSSPGEAARRRGG